MWKYGATRGVKGAPIYFANGIRLEEAASWDAATWSEFIETYGKIVK